MSDALDRAVSVDGYETRRDARRVVFQRHGGGEEAVVIWTVSEAELRRLASSRRAGGSAWGGGRTQGDRVLAVLLQEALDTFEGERGEMVMTPVGFEVRGRD